MTVEVFLVEEVEEVVEGGTQFGTSLLVTFHVLRHTPKLEPTPHFVRQSLHVVPFCEEITFSPRVGVVFTNGFKFRLLGPS